MSAELISAIVFASLFGVASVLGAHQHSKYKKDKRTLISHLNTHETLLDDAMTTNKTLAQMFEKGFEQEFKKQDEHIGTLRNTLEKLIKKNSELMKENDLLKISNRELTETNDLLKISNRELTETNDYFYNESLKKTNKGGSNKSRRKKRKL